jgi:hypothetical protein
VKHYRNYIVDDKTPIVVLKAIDTAKANGEESEDESDGDGEDETLVIPIVLILVLLAVGLGGIDGLEDNNGCLVVSDVVAVVFRPVLICDGK